MSVSSKVRVVGGNFMSNSLGTRTIRIKNLNTKEGRLLSYAVSLGANAARDVSAVAVTVGIISITGKVLEELCAAFELL